MGCDIHLTMEYVRFTNQDKTLYWDAFCESFNPGRDYCMFDVISGVRGDSGGLFPDRGLPEDISYDAKKQFFAGSGEDGEPTDEPDPDIHSVTWITCDELAQVIAKRMFHEEWPYNDAWDVLLITMRAFEERGFKTRLLIGYDN